jgi:hypothetical protein
LTAAARVGSSSSETVAYAEKEVDDVVLARELLDRITTPIASFTGDSAYDQDRVHEAVAEHVPECRDHRAAAFNGGGAEPFRRNGSDAARSTHPRHCQAWPDSLAKVQMLHNRQAKVEGRSVDTNV